MSRLAGMMATVVFVLGLTSGAATFAQEQDAQAPVTYDAFMKAPFEERVRLFNEAKPETRAALIREQIQRWLAIRRAKLSPEQVQVMEENLAFVTPALYQGPPKREDRERAQALEAKTAKLFTRAELRQALTIEGDYLPPPPQ
jgi:hypothetical protein